MTGADIELLDCEQLLNDAEEIAYRQIAPHMLVDGGKIATTAFGPNSSDNEKPSYSRSSKVSAQEARDWHTRHARSASLGVWGVSVGEVVESGSCVVDDSPCPLAESEVRAPGHCYVNFVGLSRLKKKELRARLHMCAMRRGEIATEPTKDDGQLF